METTIKKWGNSLAVRLPKHVAEKLALREGSRVEMKERKTEVVISPAPAMPRKSLAKLVQKITATNRHSEIDFLMHAAEPAFDFWDNVDDAIYDTL